MKGAYFGKTGHDLALEDLGSVLAYAYSYTIDSNEFRHKLRDSLDNIIWDRVVYDEYGDGDFNRQAVSMLDQLDSFHDELFNNNKDE